MNSSPYSARHSSHDHSGVVEHVSPDKVLPTYKWKDQLDSCRAEEDFAASMQKNRKQNGFNKVSKPLLKLLKDAEGDKMMARGKRVPLSNVSSNTIRSKSILKLEKKGESKRILNKIQSQLPELC